ncbi:MAG: membrane protease YdiL (CAAX protease family) [Pirellulaceae bacterium]|jgi:membrane protease YdiL (CAAX protease family)
MSTHDTIANDVLEPKDDAPRIIHSLRSASWKLSDIVVGIAILAPLLYFQQSFESFFRWAPDGARFALVTILPLAAMIMLPRWIAMTRGEVVKMHFPSGTKLAWEVFVALSVSIVVFVCLITVSYVYWRITNQSLGNSREYVQNISRGELMAFLLCSFTLMPIAEEVFFRGFVFNALERRCGKWANPIQAFIFAMAHPYNLIQRVVIFGLGLTLGKIYQWRRTLVSSIVVHAVLNFITAAVTVALLAAYSQMPYMGIEGEIGATGYAVAAVTDDSPAAEVGLQRGDVITHIGGENVAGAKSIKQVLNGYEIGDTTNIDVQRGEETLRLELKFGQRPDVK